jgi:hypothetical protein
MFLPRSRFFRTAVAGGGIAYPVMGDSRAAKVIKSRIMALADHVKQEMKL